MTPVFFILISVLSCVKTGGYDQVSSCVREENIEPNADFADVKALYSGEIVQIHQELIVEGYVNSSDKAGNIYGALYIQDNLVNPTEGIEIDIDVRDYHLWYPAGQKVIVKLKGLYLDEVSGVFKVGGIFKSSFGSVSVGRLPKPAVSEHLFVSCNDPGVIQPTITSIPELNDRMINTLIVINDLEIAEEVQDSMYARPLETTERLLIDCEGKAVSMRNSGYSDFQSEILPKGGGSVTAVLSKYQNKYQLYIRDLDDMDFNGDKLDCGYVTESDQIIISEIADPENNSPAVNARFIELTNIGEVDVNLSGWELRRYTNANSDYSSSVDLTGIIIQPETSVVIAADAGDFLSVYGFSPDIEGGSSSAGASNGDDNMVLVDALGARVDVFGVPGEDGTGTTHDFEDGKALRNLNVIKSNVVYDPSEWTIISPQTAPADFSPGQRN